MDDEKLIEYVRENTVLYDLSHPKYMDPKYKMSVWQSIGAEMNIPGSQCKHRWTNIRDHFRRYVQKRKTKTGQAAENIKKYKYEEHLQFILPYSTDRDKLTNVSQQATLDDIDAIQQPTENIAPLEAPQVEPNNAETSQPQTSSHSAGRIFRGGSKAIHSQMTATPSETPSALLMKYILEKNDLGKAQQPNDIDMFLAGIGSTMKKLSPYNQHIAKGRIFNIVHELEFQELFQSPYDSSNASSRNSQHCPSMNSPATGSVNIFSPSNDNAGQCIQNLDASDTTADDTSLCEYFNNDS